MAYHIAYLTKANDIPPSLVVNSDKIDIHLVPIVKYAWESKGFKHIHVLGIKDKRQVSVLVSSFPIGVLHTIFTSTTPKTLGHWNNERKTICVINKRDFPLVKIIGQT